MVDKTGRTPYGHLHGKDIQDKLCEFGEVILWFVPKTARAKLDHKWRHGIVLGRCLHTGSNWIGIKDGTVTTARAMVRVVERSRWSIDRVNSLTGIPGAVKNSVDTIEAEPEPHSFSSAETPDESLDAKTASKRRLKITLRDLGRYMFSKNCPTCRLHSQGRHSAAQKVHHTEACRLRIYKAMQAANDPKILGPDSEQPKPRDDVAPAPSTPEMGEPPAPASHPEDTLEDAQQHDADLPEPSSEAQPLSPEPAPLSADDGVDMEDTTFLYGDQANMEEDTGDAEMTNALMDALRVLGVEPVLASRFAYALVKKDRPSVLEMYGRGAVVHGANVGYRNLNIAGMDALDLRTKKPSGEAWDFTKPADRRLALWLVRTRRPTWVIGAPPCTAFSTMNAINFARMSKERVAEILKMGRLHLHFMLTIYNEQLKAGRHFLHEHPQSASSWSDPLMVQLLQHPRVHSVVAHQCAYGLTTPDGHGKPALAKKPTRFASSSVYMLRRLARKCSGDHPHQQLVAGRAANAAF